jgi:aromatic ring-opening dioxygenase LigB subunit
MIVFACFSPHPPLLLPDVGSSADRQKVGKTIESLKSLALKLKKAQPDLIIISSPHPDWGFEVPLHFLAKGIPSNQVKRILTDASSPQNHFQKGQEISQSWPKNQRIAWIASGDMSHCLKKDGSYGFHPSGPKFDQTFVNLLKEKDIKGILSLPEKLVEEAGECGLRSFCLTLGALEGSKTAWQPEVLSYEGPFGVGYLVANLKIKEM